MKVPQNWPKLKYQIPFNLIWATLLSVRTASNSPAHLSPSLFSSLSQETHVAWKDRGSLLMLKAVDLFTLPNVPVLHTAFSWHSPRVYTARGKLPA